MDAKRLFKMNDLTLADRLKEGYVDHISNLATVALETYGSMKEASTKLKIARPTLSHFKNKDTLPTWDTYFSFLLKADGKYSEELVNKLCDNLKSYAYDSLEEYKSISKLTNEQISGKMGRGKSSLSFRNRSFPPSPSHFFDLMGVIYENTGTRPGQILKPVKNWHVLVHKNYDHLLDKINPDRSKDGRAGSKKGSKQNQKVSGKAAKSKTKIDENGKKNAILSSENSLKLKESLDSLIELNSFYRNATPEEREKFRKLIRKNREFYGLTLIETRQLMREEDNYQEWIKINRLV